MRRAIGISALATLAVLLASCGDHHAAPSAREVVKDPFAYDRSRPLLARVDRTTVNGPVEVRSLSYAAADGTRVPALLAVPRGPRVRGCLMYQPGTGQAKEAATPLWPGAARLGVAMFTIDARGTGARADGPATLTQALSDPHLLVSLLRNDVIDLRRGLDYLEQQPVCHRNVGYFGISLGAVVGVMLAGADQRVRATVLSSIGATWRARMFYSRVVLPGIVNDPKAFGAAVRQLSPFDPSRWIGKISPRPVMVVDGLADPAVPPIDAMNLAAAAREPKTIVLHRGGHNPLEGPQAAQVVERIAAFLSDNLAHRAP